jgi:Resolvase, N terminal domain
MNELLVGYAREPQSSTIGVGDDRIYVDHGLKGTSRDRPGLRLELAACRAGDTLAMTKLDRSRGRCLMLEVFGRVDQAEHPAQPRRLNPGSDRPGGAVVAQRVGDGGGFEADLIRMRTREGMKVVRAKGRPRGEEPNLNRTRPSTFWTRWPGRPWASYRLWRASTPGAPLAIKPA